MFDALESLTGGGGLSGGPAMTGALTTSTNQSTEAGRVSNGGITINPASPTFDIENPVHLGTALLVGAVALFTVVKAVK